MKDWIYELWVKEEYKPIKGFTKEEPIGFFYPSCSSHFKIKLMNLETYQEIVEKTAIYPKEFGLGYVTLGLNGEFQEFCHAETEKSMLKEFGDVCWYLAASCKETGVHLFDVFPFDYKEESDTDFPLDVRIKTINQKLGVLSEKVKKIYRDGNEIVPIDFNAIYYDICVHLCELAKARGVDIELAFETNYEKLIKRKSLNMIKGSGSDREEQA